MLESGLYIGRVEHRRATPTPHRFVVPMFMVYLDLSELATVFANRWCWSTTGAALASFQRRDHFGDPQLPLDVAVRNLVEERLGRRPEGPIRLLTHLRYFGYVFNPVSFYYCFDRAGHALEAIVADITNTPWGERHQYVLPVPVDAGGRSRHFLTKDFHVSPFLPMDMDYDWRFRRPGAQLSVHMLTLRQGAHVFDATLSLRRTEITGRSLASVLIRYPLMTARLVLGIYWQALRLWIKRVPFHSRPETLS